MSARRPAAPPPALPGFTYVEVLGTGGFADVYLYEQQLPRRRVAVKVLLADRLSELSASQFTDEANVMAMLSTHPSIVTIYQAGVAGDDRPYLVMEYCSRPNLQARYRQEPFSVAEALRVGIQVAAAVETAHRAGILHRDIKPANILVTEYNRPALTDFGIASQAGAEEQAQGLSVPWSPPEAFADVAEGGVRSDVWSLGATIYSLLAARSPFEVPGGNNSTAEMMRRIETEQVPAIGRADVPPSLIAVLHRAMAKAPAARYESAVAFARALQKVQIELAHSVTPIDVVDEAQLAAAEPDDDADGTRVRGVMQIAPQQQQPPATTTQRRDDADRTRAAAVRVPAFDAPMQPTVARPQVLHQPQQVPHAPPPVPQPARPTRRTGLWIGVAVAAVLVLGGAVTAATLLVPDADPEPTASASAKPIDPIPSTVAPVENLVGTVSGNEVVFTWDAPKAQDGDRYLWTVVSLEAESEKAMTERRSVAVPISQGEKTCVDVEVLRADGRTSAAVRECV